MRNYLITAIIAGNRVTVERQGTNARKVRDAFRAKAPYAQVLYVREHTGTTFANRGRFVA